MNSVSILSPAVSRMLHDKFYEKRKTAALEIEKFVFGSLFTLII